MQIYKNRKKFDKIFNGEKEIKLKDETNLMEEKCALIVVGDSLIFWFGSMK